MKLAKLLTVDAVSDARFADLDVRGIAADSRKVEAKSACSWRWPAPRTTACAS